jgi:hypothetical protein
MNRIYLKLILGGAILGVAIYFIPFFLLKVSAVFLIFGMMAWLFGGRRRQHYRHRYWAMADHLRSMSDEDFERFKNERSHCGHRWGYVRREEQS